jgi:hypothetical protein
MGRYAFFVSTGFEYKFGFGLQSSHDILELGGTGNYGIDTEYQPVHQWTQEDKRYIQRVMDALEEHLDIDGPFDLKPYSLDVDGTSDLYGDLYEMMVKNHWSENLFFFKYRLALIIYHQLLYTDVLEVHYEL